MLRFLASSEIHCCCTVWCATFLLYIDVFMPCVMVRHGVSWHGLLRVAAAELSGSCACSLAMSHRALMGQCVK